MNTPILAWHFLPANKRTRYTDEPVEVGTTLIAKGELEVCSNGLHACFELRDALSYAPGPIICRVELSGEVIEGEDKLCARQRKVIAMADATNELRLFAADCAERALSRVKNPDPRSVAAVQGVRDFVAGKITMEALEDIRRGAAAAASAAASAAAADAAYAAYAAAYADAAYAAAADARKKEREWQNEQLTKRIETLLCSVVPHP